MFCTSMPRPIGKNENSTAMALPKQGGRVEKLVIGEKGKGESRTAFRRSSTINFAEDAIDQCQYWLRRLLPSKHIHDQGMSTRNWPKHNARGRHCHDTLRLRLAIPFKTDLEQPVQSARALLFDGIMPGKYMNKCKEEEGREVEDFDLV